MFYRFAENSNKKEKCGSEGVYQNVESSLIKGWCNNNDKIPPIAHREKNFNT
jgi:hypothetical protein